MLPINVSDAQKLLFGTKNARYLNSVIFGKQVLHINVHTFEIVTADCALNLVHTGGRRNHIL